MPKIERYGPGEDATVFDPGDFVLTHKHADLPADLAKVFNVRT